MSAERESKISGMSECVENPTPTIPHLDCEYSSDFP